MKSNGCGWFSTRLSPYHWKSVTCPLLGSTSPMQYCPLGSRCTSASQKSLQNITRTIANASGRKQAMTMRSSRLADFNLLFSYWRLFCWDWVFPRYLPCKRGKCSKKQASTTQKFESRRALNRGYYYTALASDQKLNRRSPSSAGCAWSWLSFFRLRLYWSWQHTAAICLCTIKGIVKQ